MIKIGRVGYIEVEWNSAIPEKDRPSIMEDILCQINEGIVQAEKELNEKMKPQCNDTTDCPRHGFNYCTNSEPFNKDE